MHVNDMVKPLCCHLPPQKQNGVMQIFNLFTPAVDLFSGGKDTHPSRVMFVAWEGIRCCGRRDDQTKPPVNVPDQGGFTDFLFNYCYPGRRGKMIQFDLLLFCRLVQPSTR